MDANLISVEKGFADLEDPASNYANARVVILPVPYDATACYLAGTREGPQAIITASHNMELFDEELLWSPSEVGIATLKAVEPDMRGPEWMVTAIKERAQPVIRDGKFLITIGGEHTISLGSLDAQLEHQAEEICVLQIDAHADLRDSYQGSQYSHACVMRRVLEKCPAIQVGLRSFSGPEYDFAQSKGLRLFGMDYIRSTPDWINQVTGALGPRVYLTIDLDGLDPSDCPGVGTPEPGGLHYRELTGLLKAVFAKCQVIGADVVECRPLSGQTISEYLAARLIYKLIGYRFQPAKNT
ncbi:MAG: agmatinase [Deltaproteobacteria bacterium]|nr:agmatinase [Deltaproteobacteria bacterium]